jgi:hypothetical protein
MTDTTTSGTPHGLHPPPPAGLRVQGAGFRVQGSGFGVPGFLGKHSGWHTLCPIAWLRLDASGFRVRGVGPRLHFLPAAWESVECLLFCVECLVF